MIHYGIEQGSADWHALRAGKATASRFKDIIAKGVRDNKPLKCREDYMMELAVERITNHQEPGGTFKQTEWGKANEAHARIAYCEAMGVELSEHDQISFMEHGLYATGASPDFLYANGGCEIKCPFDSIIHLNTLFEGMLDGHEAQVQGNIWIAGADWWDFVSFDPRMPEEMRLFIKRIERNEAYIRMLEDEVLRFLDELDARVSHIRSLFKPKANHE